MRLAGLVLLLPAFAHAGELDDVKQIKMKKVDTIDVVDAGKGAKQKLVFHFTAKDKRTIHGQTEKDVEASIGDDHQQAPHASGTTDTTFEVASVYRDGVATVAVSGDGVTGTISVTPRGKLGGDASAAASALPAALPEIAVGVGARWNIFQRVDMLGVKADAVTAVTLVARDGDKVILHMVQDVRLDRGALARSMKLAADAFDQAVEQNISDVTLDLSSPAISAHATLITALEASGEHADARFVQTALLDEVGKPRPATVAGALIGTWRFEALSVELAKDGTGRMYAGKDDAGAFAWHTEADKLVLDFSAVHEKKTFTIVVSGDAMVEQYDDGSMHLYRRVR